MGIGNCSPPDSCKTALDAGNPLPAECAVAQVQFRMKGSSEEGKKMTKTAFQNGDCAKNIAAKAREWYVWFSKTKVLDQTKTSCQLTEERKASRQLLSSTDAESAPQVYCTSSTTDSCRQVGGFETPKWCPISCQPGKCA